MSESVRELACLEFHTAGQGVRLIYDGIGDISGETMEDQLAAFRERHDDLRLGLCGEPRGRKGLLAAVVTEPATEDAVFGLIFFDAASYPRSCGEATIGAVTLALETGFAGSFGEVPSHGTLPVTVDTPGGQVHTEARLEDGRVTQVALRMSESRVLAGERPLEVPGLGTVPAAVCTGAGNVFVIVDLGARVEITAENAPRLLETGLRAREAATLQFADTLADLPLDALDMVELAGPLDSAGRARNVVIWGAGTIDRAPCGTGTCARLALLDQQGRLPAGDVLIHEGIVGTTFEGRILERLDGPDGPAIIPSVAGRAHLTGRSTHIISSDDPVSGGFILAG